jgi:hypothetical protein
MVKLVHRSSGAWETGIDFQLTKMKVGYAQHCSNTSTMHLKICTQKWNQKNKGVKN